MFVEKLRLQLDKTEENLLFLDESWNLAVVNSNPNTGRQNGVLLFKEKYLTFRANTLLFNVTLKSSVSIFICNV